jgi:hypothetical protein
MVPLGSIVMTAGQSKNNRTTATPFNVSGWAALEIRTTASDVFVVLVDNAAGDAVATTATGFPVAANTATRLELQGVQGLKLCESPILACQSAGGATVQVWGIWA